MIIKFLMSFFLIPSPSQIDSLPDFQKQLAKNIRLYTSLPPEFLQYDTCYHHTDLLKVEINRLSKVRSVVLSDSAPTWLKEELDKIKERNQINYKKLDSVALKAGLHNCTVVFALILESNYFPCGMENKKGSINENFFQFGGKNLKGNIIFGEQINFIWPVDYRVKK